jgi:hypothetical protein
MIRGGRFLFCDFFSTSSAGGLRFHSDHFEGDKAGMRALFRILRAPR